MTKQITNIAQFKPLPKSRGMIGMYICEAPNTTEAYAGEYSVRITFNGCAINAKTTLAINSCDNLYIKAFNPLTNVETNKLIRKPNVAAKNEYEDLILQVETLDGKIIKTMDYAWTPPAGVTLVPNPNEPYKRQTNKLGRYTVQASSANGTSCPLSIDIFAEPCTIVGDAFNCNSTGGSTIDAGQTDLANLAVGDEFTTSDYTVVVTEASKTGTTFSGKGKLIFNFLKISNTLALQIPISVTFTGIKINQCYQLYNGSVITEYDPSWGSVVSADQIKNQLSGVYAQIKDLMDNVSENAALLQQKIKDLRAARADLVNAEFTAEYKAEQLAALDAAISGMVCLVGEPPATGSRMSVTLNSSTCDAASVGASIDAAKAAGENSTVKIWNGDVFDSMGNFLPEESTEGDMIMIKTETLGSTFYRLFHKTKFTDYCIVSKILLHYYKLFFLTSSLKNGNISTQKTGRLEGCNLRENNKSIAFVDVLMVSYPKESVIGYVFTDYPSDLDNKYLVESIMYHEGLHVNGYDSDGDQTFEGIEKHLEVYFKQISHINFIKTPNSFRILITSNAEKLICYNLKNSPQRQIKWKNKFKNIGYDFRCE